MTEETYAARVRDYWRALGYQVDAEVRDIAWQSSATSIYRYRATRSNLVNGLPRGYRNDASKKLGVA